MIELFILLLIIPVLAILWRFFKGPTISNRILALDTLSIVVVALLCLLSIFFQRSIYIDVAFVFGIVGFISVILFSRYLEKGL